MNETGLASSLIRPACAADPRIPPERIEPAIHYLYHGELPGSQQTIKDSDLTPVKGKEAAAILGFSTMTIRRLANQGFIRRIIRPDGKQASAYVRQDVYAVRDGRMIVHPEAVKPARRTIRRSARKAS